MGSVLAPRLLAGSVPLHVLRIVGWALAEAIGVMGLVFVFVVSPPIQNLYPFLGVSFVLILPPFPSRVSGVARGSPCAPPGSRREGFHVENSAGCLPG